MLCFCFVEYTDDEAKIERHSSVVVYRIPFRGVKPASRTVIVYVLSNYWFYDESVKSLMILSHWFVYIRFPSYTSLFLCFCRHRSSAAVVGPSRPVCKKQLSVLFLLLLSPLTLSPSFWL